MCSIKSAIVLKDKVFMPLDTDSHEDMIKELGLCDKTNSPDFVRVEIVPDDGDLFNHESANWKFRVDQDFIPEWYSKDFAEAETRKELQRWFRERFLIDAKLTKINGGRWYLKNGQVDTVSKDAVLSELWGNSQVGVLWENSQVGELRGNSQVGVLWGNSQVGVLWGNSQVGVLRENSIIQSVLSKDAVIEQVKDSALVIVRYGDKPVILTADKGIKVKVFKPAKGKK